MLETELSPSNEKWFSDIEAPQIVDNPDLIDWSDQADLVIVGLGGAGIAAANEALDQGPLSHCHRQNIGEEEQQQEVVVFFMQVEELLFKKKRE